MFGSSNEADMWVAAFQQMMNDGGGGSIEATYGIKNFKYNGATAKISYGVTGYKYVQASKEYEAQQGVKTVEDIFRAIYNHPIGDITDEQLLKIDLRLEKVTGYSLTRIKGGVTLEIGKFKRGIINAIPNAPRINSGDPFIQMRIESWDEKTSVIHIWSSDIEIKLDNGFVPLDIYINNNAFRTIDQKASKEQYPFMDGGQWNFPTLTPIK
jgi:hypothetical protein